MELGLTFYLNLIYSFQHLVRFQNNNNLVSETSANLYLFEVKKLNSNCFIAPLIIIGLVETCVAIFSLHFNIKLLLIAILV
jgi:hypothetical protein